MLDKIPKPIPSEGELLVKVEATTINPSDRFPIEADLPLPFPFVSGKEGTGVVVEAKGENLQHWVGKRVTWFNVPTAGSWAEFVLTNPHYTFEIDADVPIACAASGTTNPLTVINMIEYYKEKGFKGGIIHTAAASALGRQLNRMAQKEGIPLLNVVRRQEQADILLSEGATHVIVTEGDWQPKLKELVDKIGFSVFFDALGGGPVTLGIIQSLKPHSRYFIIGML